MYHGGSGNASLGCAPSSNSPYGNDVPLWPVGELTGAIAFLPSTHVDTVLCFFLPAVRYMIFANTSVESIVSRLLSAKSGPKRKLCSSLERSR